MNLAGTVVPMATPTRRSRRAVDDTALRKFTRGLVEAGVHGLFPGSSIGEFPSLTAAQNRQVIETVAEVADGRTNVLAGCCDTSVGAVLDKISSAEEAGADAAVVVSPYYLTTTQPGLERFFTTIADQSALPLLLYNIPPLTGNEIGIDLVGDLAEHDNIVGLKDTSGDLNYHYRAVSETPDDFLVFQGATQLATASLGVGTDGLIAGPANVFPRVMTDLYEAYDRGDLVEAQRLMQTVVTPFVGATSDVPTAAALKYLVKLDGLDIGSPLPPLPQLTDEEQTALTAAYRRITDQFDKQTL
ncbi:dihydrodipicolinate synthase family protein [Halobellus sp. Atlit-38R]|uniref:dihydrodipicolinate synthase family protein n=1 Tax=Halobellus sp. Atlit-38R TaxID=2282131 RepID=UPI000EF1D735|nr:dihydrodipicolinate synthase family protein [Halobellus sp. Atlit-38R]RLM84248.1 dihydrodipicolinate synthase family protein [Halobellus sp. Atlit-38R]